MNLLFSLDQIKIEELIPNCPINIITISKILVYIFKWFNIPVDNPVVPKAEFISNSKWNKLKVRALLIWFKNKGFSTVFVLKLAKEELPTNKVIVTKNKEMKKTTEALSEFSKLIVFLKLWIDFLPKILDQIDKIIIASVVVLIPLQLKMEKNQ